MLTLTKNGSYPWCHEINPVGKNKWFFKSIISVSEQVEF